MEKTLHAFDPEQVRVLLRGESEMIRDWISHPEWRRMMFCVGVIALGTGLYGVAMGGWRCPMQAVYTGIKLPLVILLTAAGNALLNGMLAPLLGMKLTFSQCLMAILLSFVILAVLLGSVSSVAMFVVWNTPPLTGLTRLSSAEYGFLQLTHAGLIAWAGVTGNLRLWQLLYHWSGSAAAAQRVLVAWLSVNLLLGSQICWVLRPFIWDPSRPVEFIGREYFRGSFYETVFDAGRRLLMQ